MWKNLLTKFSPESRCYWYRLLKFLINFLGQVFVTLISIKIIPKTLLENVYNENLFAWIGRIWILDHIAFIEILLKHWLKIIKKYQGKAWLSMTEKTTHLNGIFWRRDVIITSQIDVREMVDHDHDQEYSIFTIKQC